MRRRLSLATLACLTLVAAVVLSTVTGITAARADDCSDGNPNTVDICDGTTPTPGPTTGPTHGHGHGHVPRCTMSGKPVPCVNSQGQPWYQLKECYLYGASKTPSLGEDTHKGEKGTYYLCDSNIDMMCEQVWLADGQPIQPVVDPEQVALEIRDSLHFDSPGVGLVPQDKPGSEGLVGMPTWMWADNPGPGVTQSYARKTKTVEGITVWLQAEFEGVDWDMGDGTAPVHCPTAGTPYTNASGTSDSPDCGHHYAHAGVYTVTATPQWNITYGVVRLGEIGPLDPPPAVHPVRATVRVAEMQVLNQG